MKYEIKFTNIRVEVYGINSDGNTISIGTVVARNPLDAGKRVAQLLAKIEDYKEPEM